jgi:hypothetical protein
MQLAESVYEHSLNIRVLKFAAQVIPSQWSACFTVDAPQCSRSKRGLRVAGDVGQA